MNKPHDNLEDVLHTLSALDPTPAERPRPPQQALAELKPKLSSASHTPQFSDRMKWRFQTMFKNTQSMRRAAAVLVGIALVAFVFSFPGARALASDFLGLFRVEKFAPISISPEQLARLEELDMEGIYPGEFEMLDEPGEPVSVDNLDEAAAESGLDVKTLTILGEPNEIQVQDGGSGRLIVDLESARTLLDVAGVDPTLLPDSLDGAEIEATAHPSVMQAWQSDNVMLMQMTSPEINYPTEFDPAPIGQALLELLGMPTDEAASLAQEIDWTNTMLLPIPEEFATFAEVSINGSSGLLITAVDNSHASLMWEENGVVYFIAGENVSGDALISYAEAVD